MIMPFFKRTPKRFLGVDIGTSSIKIVELASEKKGAVRLVNYGEAYIQSFYKIIKGKNNQSFAIPDENIADSIVDIIKKTKIETKQAVFSLSDFSTFFISFEIPHMSEEEIPQAVQFEARQYIPLPLSDVFLDWSVVSKKDIKDKKQGYKILLVAVPWDVINKYQLIAQKADIQLLSLEAEIFSLARALTSQEGTVGIVDMGSQSTTVSIVDEGVLKTTYSIDISGNKATEEFAKSLNIGYDEAEEVKKQQGIINDLESEHKRVLTVVDLMLSEVDRIAKNFYQTEKKEINRFILSGGPCLMPGLKEYFASWTNKSVEIANPFSNISYPLVLKETIKELGPFYAIAVGAALKNIKN